MTNFQQAAAKLAEIAKGGDKDAIKAQFSKTAKTGKACYEELRHATKNSVRIDRAVHQ